MGSLYDIIENNLFWFLLFPYIIFFGLVLIMYIYRIDKSDSISRCMVYSKKRYYFFIIFFSLGSLPLYMTLMFYLIPKYNINSMVAVVPLLIYFSQTILTIFPDNTGLKKLLHLISAFFCGFLAILFCLIIVVFGNMELYLKLLVIQFIITVNILLLLLLFCKKIKKYVFIIEVISIIDWIITIFSLSFIK